MSRRRLKFIGVIVLVIMTILMTTLNVLDYVYSWGYNHILIYFTGFFTGASIVMSEMSLSFWDE